MRRTKASLETAMDTLDCRFAQIAMDGGLMTAGRLKKAQHEQSVRQHPDGCRKTLPQVLLEQRWMGYSQIEDVLSQMF